MASNNNIGSTALVIAAWFVAAFLAIKYLPSILGGASRAAFGSGGQGGPLSSTFGGYAPGLPFSSPVPISQALSINGLTPDSKAALTSLYDAANGLQPNGMPLTSAQQVALLPQYDAGAGAGALSYLSTGGLPDSDFLQFSAGDDPFPTTPLSQYDAGAGAGALSYLPAASLPDSGYLQFSAGDDPFPADNSSDYASGGFDPDNYVIDATIPYDGD